MTRSTISESEGGSKLLSWGAALAKVKAGRGVILQGPYQGVALWGPEDRQRRFEERKGMTVRKVATRRRNTSGLSDLPTDPRLDQWMICRQPGGEGYYAGGFSKEPNPKKLYTDEKQARKDAEYLCNKEQIPFFLLRVVAVVEQQQAPVVWIEDE